MTKKTSINMEFTAMHELMCTTMEKFSNHFIKNKSLSKDDFFNIQKKVLVKIAKKYNIKLTGDSK